MVSSGSCCSMQCKVTNNNVDFRGFQVSLSSLIIYDLTLPESSHSLCLPHTTDNNLNSLFNV